MANQAYIDHVTQRRAEIHALKLVHDKAIAVLEGKLRRLEARCDHLYPDGTSAIVTGDSSVGAWDYCNICKSIVR